MAYANFVFTKGALKKLEEALICNLCKERLCEPVLVGRCEHVFCKKCVTGYCGKECPECHVPVAAKESHTDLPLNMLLTLCGQLNSILYQNKGSDEGDTDNVDYNDSAVGKGTSVGQNLAEVMCDKRTESMTSSVGQPTTPTSSKTVGTSSRRISVTSALNSSLRSVSLYSPPSLDKKVRSRSATSKFKDKRNVKGETLLHVAAIKGNVAKVQELLKKGANPNVKDYAGWTPLHEASHHGYKEIVACLLDYGANVNVPGLDNVTPLHDAIMNKQVDVAQYLASRGGDLHTRTAQGFSVLDFCVKAELKESLMNAALQYITESDTLSLSKTTPATQDAKSKVVFLPTGLNYKQKEILVGCAQLLDARIVEEFCNEVTHVVAACDDMGQCNRTLKVLQGILGGKWILNLHWVELCIEYKQKLSEEIYEIPGTKQQRDTYGPKRGRENMLHQFPPLFDGCNFYLYGQFSPPAPTREDICSLIQQGGGKILLREPRPDTTAMEHTVPYHASSCSKLSDASHFILFQFQPPRDIYISTGPVRTVNIFWLIDSISTFQLLDPDRIDIPKTN